MNKKEDLQKQKKRIVFSLIAVLMVVVTAVILPVGFFSYQVFKSSMLNQIYRDNTNFAEAISIIIRSELATKSRDELLSDLNNINIIKIAESGYVCIYDDYGTLLVHPNKELVEKKFYVGSDYLMTEDGRLQLIELIRQKKDYVGIYNSSLGEIQIAAFHSLPEAGLVIGVNQPYSEIQQLFDKVRGFFIMSTAFAVVMIFVLSVLLMNKVIQPYYDALEESLTERVRLEGELREHVDGLEHKIKERTSELRASEEKYRNLVENSSDAIFTLDNEDRFTFCNKRAEEITGYTCGELIGKKFGELIVRKDTIPSSELSTICELELLRKDGSKTIVELSMSAMFKDGKIAGKQCIARDVTKRKEMESRMMQAERLASVGRLAAGVAHQINNPLANISITAQMLLAKKGNSADAQDLKLIVDQAEAASKITHDLLDFSRAREPRMEMLSVNDEILKVLKLLSSQLSINEIKVEHNLDSALPEISGDVKQLQQVFVNIINNAVEAMPKGGTLKIATQTQDGYVEVRISDTGIGIPEKHLGKIFDPFFTTKEVGKGTGLGLSVAHGIVEKHGGSIGVESKLNRGTTFIIKLPIKRE